MDGRAKLKSIEVIFFSIWVSVGYHNIITVQNSKLLSLVEHHKSKDNDKKVDWIDVDYLASRCSCQLLVVLSGFNGTVAADLPWSDRCSRTPA